jgi:hypothetical protein
MTNKQKLQEAHRLLIEVSNDSRHYRRLLMSAIDFVGFCLKREDGA